MFQAIAPPTTAELSRLLERIVQRVLALLTRRGYWVADHDTAYLQEPNHDEVLGPLQAAACSYRIAMGPRAGRKAMSIRTLEARPSGEGNACVESNGFSPRRHYPHRHIAAGMDATPHRVGATPAYASDSLPGCVGTQC